jgi:hypothetical protein
MNRPNRKIALCAPAGASHGGWATDLSDPSHADYRCDARRVRASEKSGGLADDCDQRTR